MRTTLSLWRPPDETVEAIAAVLSSRWSAARSQPGGLFRTHTTSWLRQPSKLADDSPVFGQRYWRALTERCALPHHLTSGGRLIR